MKRLRFIRGRQFAENESGGTLAELAILVPFLLIMMAAVTELGRLFQTYTTISKSTRAAARYLSNNAYQDKYIQNARRMALCGKTDCTGTDPVVSGLEIGDIVVTPEYKEGGGGAPVTVTVSIQNYTFVPVFNLAAMLGADRYASLPVRPSTTMYYMWTDPAGATE